MTNYCITCNTPISEEDISCSTTCLDIYQEELDKGYKDMIYLTKDTSLLTTNLIDIINDC